MYLNMCIFFFKASLTSFCLIAQNLLEISENWLTGAILKTFHVFENYDVMLWKASCKRFLVRSRGGNNVYQKNSTLP